MLSKTITYHIVRISGATSTFGAVGIIGSVAVLGNRSRTKHWLWLPFATTFYCLLVPFTQGWFFHLAIHPMDGRPLFWATEMTRRDLLTISWRVTEAAETAGRFSCTPGGLKRPSRFAFAGDTLDYDMRCVMRGAPGLITAVPSERPAIITMVVSQDGTEAWFSVTTLTVNADMTAAWLTGRDRNTLVIHQAIKDLRDQRGI
jgi:hypothetical protein